MPTKTPNLQDLKQFEIATTRSTKCQVCLFAEREWIETAKAQGHGASVISKYLVTKCGYPEDLITEDRIKHHFRKNHHLRSNGKK